MMDENKINEELSVTPLIRDFERLIGKGFRGLKRLLYLILEGIAEFFMLAFKYVWVLGLAVILGGAIGYFSTKFLPGQYASSMVLRLNVDAKDQLINDVNYFNALVSRGDYRALAKEMGIAEENATYITGFEIYAHSDYIEKTMALQDLYGAIDTALFNSLEMNQLLAQNDITLSARFKIVITATQPDVFGELEGPFLNYLERVPELNDLLVANVKALHFQREVFQHEMASIDTLNKVLNEVMLTRAAQPQSNNGGDMNLVMAADGFESTDITPIDLQDRYIFYAQKIAKIDNEIERHKKCYFVSSHLNPYGEKIGYGRLKRAILGGFALFTLVYLIVGFRYWGKKDA